MLLLCFVHAYTWVSCSSHLFTTLEWERERMREREWEREIEFTERAVFLVSFSSPSLNFFGEKSKPERRATFSGETFLFLPMEWFETKGKETKRKPFRQKLFQFFTRSSARPLVFNIFIISHFVEKKFVKSFLRRRKQPIPFSAACYWPVQSVQKLTPLPCQRVKTENWKTNRFFFFLPWEGETDQSAPSSIEHNPFVQRTPVPEIIKASFTLLKNHELQSLLTNSSPSPVIQATPVEKIKLKIKWNVWLLPAVLINSFVFSISDLKKVLIQPDLQSKQLSINPTHHRQWSLTTTRWPPCSLPPITPQLSLTPWPQPAWLPDTPPPTSRATTTTTATLSTTTNFLHPRLLLETLLCPHRQQPRQCPATCCPVSTLQICRISIQMFALEDPEGFPLPFPDRDSGQEFHLTTNTLKAETGFSPTLQSPRPLGTHRKLSGIRVRPSGQPRVTFRPADSVWRACCSSKTTFCRTTQSFPAGQDLRTLHPGEAAKDPEWGDLQLQVQATPTVHTVQGLRTEPQPLAVTFTQQNSPTFITCISSNNNSSSSNISFNNNNSNSSNNKHNIYATLRMTTTTMTTNVEMVCRRRLCRRRRVRWGLSRQGRRTSGWRSRHTKVNRTNLVSQTHFWGFWISNNSQKAHVNIYSSYFYCSPVKDVIYTLLSNSGLLFNARNYNYVFIYSN